ncbi:hypothetical protein [Trueperella pyogenes]
MRILPVDSRIGLASRTCCAFDDAVGHKEVFWDRSRALTPILSGAI